MITCNLIGGLGNQMFQISATYALALRNNDICGFDFSSCHTPLQGNPSNKYKDNIFKNITDCGDLKFRVHYSEPSFAYNELPYATGLSISGYFQSEKYFIDFEKKIKELFVIDNTNAKNFIDGIDKQGLPITTIHVRRGDYLNNKEFHNTCNMDYYLQARIAIGDSIFIIVSDDMEWVKENIKGNWVYYSPFTEEIDDLSLMIESDNVITANSSFSWWGAYLNTNKNKKIISPKKWFGPNGPKDIQDIIPENWLKY